MEMREPQQHACCKAEKLLPVVAVLCQNYDFYPRLSALHSAVFLCEFKNWHGVIPFDAMLGHMSQ